MILIIGGAYQGKLDYAKETFHLKEEWIYECADTEIDFSKSCINGIEEFCFACVKKGIEPLDYFRENEDKWHSSILICEDIFCGVVPLGADLREWRQATGRLCKYLSQRADTVMRIFCGLGQRLK